MEVSSRFSRVCLETITLLARYTIHPWLTRSLFGPVRDHAHARFVGSCRCGATQEQNVATGGSGYGRRTSAGYQFQPCSNVRTRLFLFFRFLLISGIYQLGVF